MGKHHLYRWPKPIFDETKNDTKPIHRLVNMLM